MNPGTVIYNWPCNMGKHGLPSTSSQSPGHHPWFLPHTPFPHRMNHQLLWIFPPSFLNPGPLLQLLCLCLSLDSHHFLTGLRTGCFTSYLQPQCSMHSRRSRKINCWINYQLLCIRPCSRLWGYSWKWHSPNLCVRGFRLTWMNTHMSGLPQKLTCLGAVCSVCALS